MGDRGASAATGTAARRRYFLGDAFVVEHGPADGQAAAGAVLVLPPLGYEDSCAYRPLWVLSEVLAAQGRVVVQLDWPGQGDSRLDAAAGGLVEPWIRAVTDAIADLRGRGFSHLTAVAVRGGGLVALALEGLDALVLWGTPGSGQRYLREERAFHRLAARSFGEAPADRPTLPRGAQEAGGFVYAPATVAALKELELTGRGVRRALLIPREGAAFPQDLVATLSAGGAEVQRSAAAGLGALLENAYQAALTAPVRDAILAWLGPVGPRARRPPGGGAPALDLGGGVIETPWTWMGGAGELSGVVCAPPGGLVPGQAWTIFFNAGGIRRSGPNRLWTRAARSLARRGRPSLRFDVRDVGDSDGAHLPHPDLEAMYSEASIGDGLDAYDWVASQDPGSVDVVGLCSGAFMGAQIAARRQVRRATLFNGLAFVWDDDARASSMTSHIRASLLDGRRWRRLLTGRIDVRALGAAVIKKGRIGFEDTLSRLRGRPPASAVARLFGEIAARGTALHLVSSAGDPSLDYLNRHVEQGQRPMLTILPGVDHTIRPVWSHPRVIGLMVEPPRSRGE